MMKLTSEHNVGDTLSFVPSFEGIHSILAEIYVYLFDKHGDLIDRQIVRKGRAVISCGAEIQRCTRVVLGPRIDNLVPGPITLEKVRAFHAFEPACQIGSGATVQFLPEVPESVWRWWVVHGLWATLKTGSDTQPTAAIF